MVRLVCLSAFILMVCASTVAAKKPVEKVVVADTAEKFDSLVAQIHSQMAPGKRYEFLGKSDRAKVDMSFEKMSSMLASSGSVDAMSSEERMKLFNEQEKVNGLLAKNSDDRLVCNSVAPVGSHLPVKTCKTVREIEKERNNSRRDMQNMTNGRINSNSGN